MLDDRGARAAPCSVRARRAACRRLSRAAAPVLGAVLLAGCALAPPELEPTYARAPPRHGALHRLHERIEADLAAGESAVRLLNLNDEAYWLRLALADEAAETLDIQTFIWDDDATSLYLARRVIAAGDRGVRVRVLLDDIATAGLDTALAALDMHPNIEIRLFNPWRSRTKPGRFIEFLLRFGTLNHRMHNKAIIADNRFAIIGGRNIGDHYFGLDPVFAQNDLDVLLAGPVVGELSDQFDLYWNSEESYAVDAVLKERDRPESLDAIVAEIERQYMGERELLAEFMPSRGRSGEWLESVAASHAQGPAELYFDLPQIDTEQPTRLYREFKALLAGAEREVLISSPYFIPDQEFVDLLAELRARGVRVVVLTNSLGATNHATAHTGYKHWRRKVLRADVDLYEARTDAAILPQYWTPPIEAGRLGLHSKSAVIDARYSFIGSPNVDPRSMILNTEIGVVVDDRELAAELKALFERDIAPENAWRVELTEDNWLIWSNGQESVMRQPARGFLQRMVEFFLNVLPIKNQA